MQGTGKREQGTGKRKRGFAYISNRSLVSCFILFSLFSFLLLSCAPGGDNLNSDIPAGMGRVTIRLGNQVSRTILPTAPSLTHFKVIRVQFGPNASPVHNVYYSFDSTTSTSLPFFTLAAGTYQVTVEAFTTAGTAADLSDSTGLAARFTDPAFEVEAGEVNDLDVNLKMLLGETGTTGTFTWDITIPEPPASSLNITTASMEIFTLAGIKQGSTIDLLNDPSGTFSTALSSGMYNVIVNLVHTETLNSTPFERSVVVWHEILHIYSTLTSDWTYEFTEEHFNLKTYIVAFDINTSGAGDVSYQSVLHNGTISPLPSPTRNGFILDGWYTGKNGTGNKLTTTTQILNDIDYFANWIQDTTVVVNISVDPIADSTIIFVDENDIEITLPALITLSRSGSIHPNTYEIKIDDNSEFTSISWQIANVDSGTTSGTGNSFTINANDASYNSIGTHLLRLTVVKGGVSYQRNIPFKIIE